MRISVAFRVVVLATAAISALTTAAINSERNVAAFDAPVHDTRVLTTSVIIDGDDDVTPAPQKRQKKTEEATSGSADSPRRKKSNKTLMKEAAEKEAAQEAEKEAAKKAADKEAKNKAIDEAVEEAEVADALREAAKEAKEEKKAQEVKKAKEAKEKQEKEETQVAQETEAPKKKKKKVTRAPNTGDQDNTDTSGSGTKSVKKGEKTAETEERAEETAGNSVNEKKIKGNKKEGVIDGSSEGTAEIDKIDLRNNDGWVSVYDDPPLLVIKASLYAFISYNDTEVCDTFNMTMNAVEQKVEDNGRFSYHVVTYINCTKNNEDETQGRFILNFIPEGKRLLLTECGHREEGEIVNWLRIQEEVPECMTPKQRKEFLAQPMKHIHVSNGTNSDMEAVQTDFLSRLEEFDTEEVAIFSTATVALIAIIVVLVIFCIRKRKAQKDLERTIAGAKAEHAVEDDDVQIEAEEKATKERKGLMDSVKAKSDDPDMEEGSFVNSPAVRV